MLQLLLLLQRTPGCLKQYTSPEASLLPTLLPVVHLDGHAGAVEALREEHILATQSVVRRCKLQLGQGEGVAQVQHAIHIRVREGAKELFGGAAAALRRRIDVKRLGGLPLGLSCSLQRQQQVAAGRGALQGWVGMGGRAGQSSAASVAAAAAATAAAAAAAAAGTSAAPALPSACKSAAEYKAQPPRARRGAHLTGGDRAA